MDYLTETDFYCTDTVHRITEMAISLQNRFSKTGFLPNPPTHGLTPGNDASLTKAQPYSGSESSSFTA